MSDVCSAVVEVFDFPCSDEFHVDGNVVKNFPVRVLVGRLVGQRGFHYKNYERVGNNLIRHWYSFRGVDFRVDEFVGDKLVLSFGDGFVLIEELRG